MECVLYIELLSNGNLHYACIPKVFDSEINIIQTSPMRKLEKIIHVTVKKQKEILICVSYTSHQKYISYNRQPRKHELNDI